jgi:transcriptional regulator with XRE-family HTH domain
MSTSELRCHQLPLPEWAQRVVTLRPKLGLLQVQFAEQLAVKQASVSRWESGSREPSVENYIRMGNLADEADCIWFWERAGVDMKRIERWISARKMPGKKSQKP